MFTTREQALKLLPEMELLMEEIVAKIRMAYYHLAILLAIVEAICSNSQANSKISNSSRNRCCKRCQTLLSNNNTVYLLVSLRCSGKDKNPKRWAKYEQ